MFRLLVLIHRYLGIAIGLIVALWCLSGFVMMYVQYPDLSEWEYLTGLPTIDTENCCTVDSDVLDQLEGVDEISVEMLAGQPVLRARFGRSDDVEQEVVSADFFEQGVYVVSMRARSRKDGDVITAISPRFIFNAQQDSSIGGALSIEPLTNQVARIVCSLPEALPQEYRGDI